MSEIKVDTANIPQHIADALCEDLLKSIKEYIRNNPGAAEELERRGREVFRRIKENEDTKRTQQEPSNPNAPRIIRQNVNSQGQVEIEVYLPK